jgi:hypothetical protein
MAKYTALADSVTGGDLDVYTKSGVEIAPPFDLPSKVVIQGLHYQVRYHTRIYDKQKKGFRRLHGVVLYSPQVIVLDPEQTIHGLRKTLYHEMAHVYLVHNQIAGSSLGKLNPGQVETLCDLFAEAHYDALLNGPKL